MSTPTPISTTAAARIPASAPDGSAVRNAPAKPKRPSARKCQDCGQGVDICRELGGCAP